MEARIKSNGRIIKDVLAKILVKNGKAVDLEVEKANKAKVQKMNEAKKAKATEKQKQPIKQVKKPLEK